MVAERVWRLRLVVTQVIAILYFDFDSRLSGSRLDDGTCKSTKRSEEEFPPQVFYSLVQNRPFGRKGNVSSNPIGSFFWNFFAVG